MASNNSSPSCPIATIIIKAMTNMSAASILILFSIINLSNPCITDYSTPKVT
jgi:hypothetical protein